MALLIEPRRILLVAAIAVTAIFLSTLLRPGPASASPDTVFAVSSNSLVRFDSSTPGTVTTVGPLTGLQASEQIVAIDFRPATGQLYGIGTTGQLYTINTSTAAATAVGAPVAGVTVETSIDFNPTVDRIRVVNSASDTNFRLHPDTGALVATDTTLAYDAVDPNTGVNPELAAIGYTNNTAGAATTTLYGIDSGLDILVRQGGVDGNPSPNAGQLFTVGLLGTNTAAVAGLDIAAGNTALALLEVGLTSQLYTINLTTGAATLLGNIGGASAVQDIAAQVIPPSPSPSATATATTVTGTSTPTPSRASPAALPPTGGSGPDAGATTASIILLLVMAAALPLAIVAWHLRRVVR